MPREIKFRVWDGSIYHYSDLLIPRNINGKGPNDYLVYNTDLVYQQFTGILDRNGRDIYEGDFVKAEAIKGEINFVDGAYFIGDDLLFEANALLAGNLIVLGNIFQNQELLGN